MRLRRELLEPDRGSEPRGPAPTITTSNSMVSRSITSSKGMLHSVCGSVWLSAGREVYYVGVIPAQVPESSTKRKPLDTGFRRYDDQEQLNMQALIGR